MRIYALQLLLRILKCDVGLREDNFILENSQSESRISTRKAQTWGNARTSSCTLKTLSLARTQTTASRVARSSRDLIFYPLIRPPRPLVCRLCRSSSRTRRCPRAVLVWSGLTLFTPNQSIGHRPILECQQTILNSTSITVNQYQAEPSILVECIAASVKGILHETVSAKSRASPKDQDHVPAATAGSCILDKGGLCPVHFPICISSNDQHYILSRRQGPQD